MKLFKDYYEPKLIENGIENVVLRTYKHIKGFATDDPSNSTELIFTPRKEVDQRMDTFVDSNSGVAITSLVGVKTEQRYLFLLDCGLSVSTENERELIEILRNSRDSLPALGSGMILRTLNSYHVIGFVPLNKTDWQNHMAKAILLRTKNGEPIGDIRYIGHSLEREYGSLRLSDYLGKPTPEFICYV